MIVLDTTVLVYAAGGHHPLRGPCRVLLEAVTAGRAEATTTPEVIQEFAHVHSQRRPRHDAVELGRSFVDLLSPLVVAQAHHLSLGLDLFERHPQLGAFDALLAAVAIEAGAEALVSADQAFAAVPGLHHVVPATEEFDRLLART